MYVYMSYVCIYTHMNVYMYTYVYVYVYVYTNTYMYIHVYMYLVQFSRSVVSDALRSHELQHARPPGGHPNSCPLSW